MPTLLELFQSSGLNNSVESDKKTLVEQETSGIRIKSAVELNNPILYGNEAIRIVNRTTSAVEKQRTANADCCSSWIRDTDARATIKSRTRCCSNCYTRLSG